MTGDHVRQAEITNRLLLRARDEIDRGYASPLDVASLARIAHVSEAHFIRTFKVTFGETPHRYLQRRRIEHVTDEPSTRPYGIDFGIRDPFGNSIRIGQMADMTG